MADNFENFVITDIIKNIETTMKLFASHPAFDSIVKQANMTGNISGLQTLTEITQQYSSIFSGNDLFAKSFISAFTFQTELLQCTQNYHLTEAIISLRNNLAHNNYFPAIEALAESFKSPLIEAPDIALLKLYKPLMEISEFELPRGLRSAIDSLHISTAQDLSVSDRVSYDSNQANFIITAEPENSCTAKEANVVYSAARLFDEITAEELLSFLCHLSTYYSLGASHAVGKKILRIVKGNQNVTSFDNEIYFHARSLDDGACPFTNEDMTRAPHGLTSFGRFNHIGENYFYFSNQKAGAIEEVKKHSPKNRVQIAKLRAKGDIKMIDISDEKENTFLKYYRFPFEPKYDKKVPREYLIPSFFSDCCKWSKLDGIKYYGTKDYFNYVTWEDGYFVFLDEEVL